MTKLTSIFLGLFAITIALTSCSVEKRVHQKGYHISWKHRHSEPFELTQTKEQTSNDEVVVPSTLESPQPNVHSVETISANSNEETVLFLSRKNPVLNQAPNDTIVPDQTKQQEEYFSNTYTPPSRQQSDLDTQQANWALGLGIGAVSTPIWAFALFLLAGSLTGFSWTLLGLFFLIGAVLFIVLEVTAISLAIRFLRLHAKDPNYRKYRGRAITGLILAGIYPALIVINILLAALLAI